MVFFYVIRTVDLLFICVLGLASKSRKSLRKLIWNCIWGVGRQLILLTMSINDDDNNNGSNNKNNTNHKDIKKDNTNKNTFDYIRIIISRAPLHYCI